MQVVCLAGSAEPAYPGRMRASLFRDRDFRLVAGSVGLSALGDWVAIVALGRRLPLFRDRLLALVMTVAFASLLFMSAVWVGELFFVEDVLDRGNVAYGSMLSIWTMGMALGAMLLSRRVAAAAVAAVGLVAAATQGLALALPALWLSFAFFLACSFMGGVAHGLKNVMFRSLIHFRVPDRLHGRAFAAYNGIRNTAELGAFAAGGVLVAAIGARGTLAYAGGLSALAGLAGVVALLRMNRGWAPTGPVGPAIDPFEGSADPPGPGQPVE